MYKSQPKLEKRSSWGSKLFSKVLDARKKKKHTKGQMTLPWAVWETKNAEIALGGRKACIS